MKLLARADIVLFIVAVINLGSSWMSVTNRTQAMAAANGSYFGGWFSEFNERFGTPLRVDILSGIVGSAFTIAAMLIVVGSIATLAPSLVYKLFSVPYSFTQTWGVSGTRFELFTLGTVAVVVLLVPVGYLFGDRSEPPK